jgi:ABC-type molybdate transport system substrate-binding protein
LSRQENVMTRWTNVAGLLALMWLWPGAVQAAEITVLGGMGVISGIRDLAAGFQSATGHKVNALFDANPLAKVNAGAPADIVALNPPVIDDLIKSGKVVGERVDFARAGIGVAVKAGAGKLDLSSVGAFKRAMLNAKSIGYSTAGSGLMVAKIIKDLGLTDELKARTKFRRGGGARRGRDRAAADQRHPAGRRRRARRRAAARAAAIQRVRGRRARGLERERRRHRNGQVHGRPGERSPGAQERNGATRALKRSILKGIP